MDKEKILESLTKIEQNGTFGFTWESIMSRFDGEMLVAFLRSYSLGEIVVIQDQKCILDTGVSRFLDDYILKFEQVNNEAVSY